MANSYVPQFASNNQNALANIGMVADLNTGQIIQSFGYAQPIRPVGTVAGTAFVVSYPIDRTAGIAVVRL